MMQPSIAMLKGATSTVVSITLQLLEGESPLRWCHEFNFSFQTSNLQINVTILSLNMYFSVHIVHFQVIWGPGKFGLKIDWPPSPRGAMLRFFTSPRPEEKWATSFKETETELRAIILMVLFHLGRLAKPQTQNSPSVGIVPVQADKILWMFNVNLAFNEKPKSIFGKKFSWRRHF